MKKFLVLGLLSTLLDLVVYTSLIYFQFNYIVAIIIGYLCGFFFNFYAGRKFIFKNGRKVKSFFAELSSLIVINIIAILMNIFIVYMLYKYLEIIDEFGARLIAIVVVFFWNYFARKIFVYH